MLQPSVLLVDDRPENLLALEAILDTMGLTLVRANSGTEALKALLQQEFALILMDVQMPGMNGLETATLIKERERTRYIPIIFLTAINKEERYVFEGYAVGAVDYLFKPFDPVVLRSKVAVFIELYKKGKELEAQSERLRAVEQREHELAVASARRESEREAARSRELAVQKRFVERLIEHAPAGIAYVDAAGICRSVNPEFARFAGKGANALLGTAIRTTLGPALELVEPAFEHVVSSGEQFREIGLPAPWAGNSYWDLVYFPVLEPEGGVEGVLVFTQEVSDRVENERLQRQQIEHLRQVDTMKDEFLSVISHELRTPLNFIMGFASILQDEVAGELGPDQHKYVEKILNGTDRMLLLVNDLLDFAKIQAGELELVPLPFPYGPLVSEVLATLTPLADTKRITLQATVQPEFVALCDPQRVLQILTNLVGNAIKFTPEEGIVHVAARLEGGAVVTQVEDTGIGIAEPDLDKLFTRFKQLDMSRTREAGGTGLGLSIAKALVEAHQGQIVASSAGIGHGATFQFTLPASSEVGARPGVSRV